MFHKLIVYKNYLPDPDIHTGVFLAYVMHENIYCLLEHALISFKVWILKITYYSCKCCEIRTDQDFLYSMVKGQRLILIHQRKNDFLPVNK